MSPTRALAIACVVFSIGSPAHAADVADGTTLPGLDKVRLSLVACNGSRLPCLRVRARGATREIRLGDAEALPESDATLQHVEGARLVAVGNYAGGAWPEVAVLYAERDAIAYHGALRVVDVESGRVLARARSPEGVFNVYVDALRAADGRLVPFVAPSYAASSEPAPELGPGSKWDYLCAYAPTAPGDARCGEHFTSIEIGASHGPGGAPASFFKEVGGYLQDADGDGWEDIHLIYHSQIRIVSVARRQVIGVVRYDIATDPATIGHERFAAAGHSGRNYGTHSAVRARDGRLRVVMVGGAPVDAFGRTAPATPGGERPFRDLYCNVSRFIGVLEQPPRDVAARHLAWARYFGFDSSTFEFPTDVSAGRGRVLPVAPQRYRGDFMDGCVHRYADSRVVVGARALVAVDVFHATEPQNTCVREQYQLYFDGWTAGYTPPSGATAADAHTWSTLKQKLWNECKADNVRRRGRWSVELYDEASGAPVASLADAYVWGWASDLVAGAPAFVVERIAAGSAFDITWDFVHDRPRTPGRLELVTWDGDWRTRGVFSGAMTRPKIMRQPQRGGRGLGDYSYFATLHTADVDGDGRVEVQLEDGSWYGASARGDDLSCKKDCAARNRAAPAQSAPSSASH